MKVKEYLQQLRRLDMVIDQKIAELDSLRSRSVCLRSPDYSGERVQKSPSGEAPYAAMIDRMVDLNNEINREIDEFVEKKHRIVNQIQRLDDVRYVQILYKRYVEYKDFNQIAVEMGYSYQYTALLHGYALRAFYQRFPKVSSNLS